MSKPLPLLKLKARMVLAEIDLRTVARRAKVEYTRASEVLNGSRIDPKSLSRLSRIIESMPIRGGVAA